MYRVTRKSEQRRAELAAIRHTRDVARLDEPAPDYPSPLPDLRRRLVVESFDFGHEVHVMEFFKTDRIDCFRVLIDGKEWKRRIGFSQALAGLRKSMPRVGSE